MLGMNRYKILKCFITEKRNCRQAFLSGDRSYCDSCRIHLNYSVKYLVKIWICGNLRDVNSVPHMLPCNNFIKSPPYIICLSVNCTGVYCAGVSFSWEDYLKETEEKPAPENCFKQVVQWNK